MEQNAKDFRSSLNLHGARIHKNIDIELLKSSKITKSLDFNDPEINIDYDKDFTDEIHDFNTEEDYWMIDSLGNIKPRNPFKFSVDQLTGLSKVGSTGSYTDLLNLPTYHKVATTGRYEDLDNPMFVKDEINTITTEHPRWDTCGNIGNDIMSSGTDSLNFSFLPNGSYDSGSFSDVCDNAKLWCINDNNDSPSYLSYYDYSGGNNFNLSQYAKGTNLFGIRLYRNVTTDEELLSDGTILYDIYIGNNDEKYNGTKIGNYIWLKENLRETKDNTGKLYTVSKDANVDRTGVIYSPTSIDLGNAYPFKNDEYAKAYGYLYSYDFINSDRILLLVNPVNNVNDNVWKLPTYSMYEELKTIATNHPDGLGSIKSRRQVNSPYLTRTDVVKPSNQRQIHHSKIVGLHKVATSGRYTDLLNLPALHSVSTSGNYNDLSGKPALHSVATSGNYNDLLNLPTTLHAQNSDKKLDIYGETEVNSKEIKTLLLTQNLTNISTKQNNINYDTYISLKKKSSVYGYLYNYYAMSSGKGIMNKNLPETWRVMSTTDYDNLITVCGGTTGSIPKLMSKRSKLMEFPNVGNFPTGTDIYNFGLLPAGRRTNSGNYTEIGIYIYLWLSNGSITASSGSLTITKIGSITTYEYKYGYPIRLCRQASTEELLLSNGTYTKPYVGNDGKIYPTVKIGTLIYLAENLAETKFYDQTTIPNYSNAYTDDSWAALAVPGLTSPVEQDLMVMSNRKGNEDLAYGTRTYKYLIDDFIKDLKDTIKTTKEITTKNDWNGTQLIVNLSSDNLYNHKIVDTTTSITFGISTGSDNLTKSHESIVIVDNSANTVAITSIIFDTMSALYSYEWYGKTIPTTIPAGSVTKFIFRNISGNKISVETNI